MGGGTHPFPGEGFDSGQLFRVDEEASNSTSRKPVVRKFVSDAS